ncbi:LuxR C-terminal-related transcriptional regulator [Actinomycetospora chibensis]|uniref:LuxR C-terminal-related transcriptional regulator n=1 Tax=Actinomycetospora chibensis TaxID=663606 RepID=A0ABV9RNC4_9PSEU|nr:LuxR C-terminal-related transcriptional regulator [Actinomycetospora chibensis]MDD7922727.1 LuxR C-terminal-related transcriptional regulator [Actinomycetospora chibensis]
MRWAKTMVPLRPPGFVERPTLDALLDQYGEAHEYGRVVLVSAPAGQGKTAAVAEWTRRHPETPTAWVSLEPTDRDAACWWDTVLGALDTVLDPVEHRPGPRRDQDPMVMAHEAHEALEALPDGAVLVLDDVHEIVGHPALDGLLALLRHPRPRLTIVLCSRFDPPVGLERLRLHGRLAQVRVAQLSFDRDDAARLFAAHGVRLAEDEVATLVDRTEGWVAALRLAAMSLQELEDVSAFVADFAGDDRSVADYLVDEVLAVLDERQIAVLETGCVSTPLPVELAVELSGIDDAAIVLDRLESATALVNATDRRRTLFRTHELLRSHVLARLRRRDPARLADLHQRAASWYEQRGEHPQALRCAAAAGDVPTVQLLLRSRAIELLGQGAFDALLHTERVLAGAADDPRVRLLLGLSALERGDLDHGERLIDSAERELAAHRPLGHQSGNLVVFRRIVAARAAFVRGRLPAAIAVGATIDPDAVDDVALRALALITRGTALLASDRDQSRRDCQEALTLAESRDWPYLALQAQSTLALADNHAGERARLQRHARAVIARARAEGWGDSSWTLRAWFALATSEVLRGRPHEATERIAHAEAACPPDHPHFAAALAVLRGAAEHDTGETFEGWRRIRHARTSRSEDSTHEVHTKALAALLEQQAALAGGRAREAGEVTRAMSADLAGTAELALLRARNQWSVRDVRARRTLDPVLTGELRALTSLVVVEAPLLDAEIALERGETSIARDRLRRALALAHRSDVVRPLRHLPEALRRFLAEHRGGFAELDPLVDEVLTGSAPAVAAAHHLTARERDVLDLLPTMRSSADIAHDLTVSVNTVKTHQRAIYQKLGVENRRQAVTRARQIGLLVSERPRSAH